MFIFYFQYLKYNLDIWMVYAFFVEMKVISIICIAVLTVQVSTGNYLKHNVYNPNFMLRAKKILTRK